MRRDTPNTRNADTWRYHHSDNPGWKSSRHTSARPSDGELARFAMPIVFALLLFFGMALIIAVAHKPQTTAPQQQSEQPEQGSQLK